MPQLLGNNLNEAPRGVHKFVKCDNDTVISDCLTHNDREWQKTEYTYYDNGKMKEEGKYENGKLDGVCKYYNEGQLIAVATYQDGIEVVPYHEINNNGQQIGLEADHNEKKDIKK